LSVAIDHAVLDGEGISLGVARLPAGQIHAVEQRHEAIGLFLVVDDLRGRGRGEEQQGEQGEGTHGMFLLIYRFARTDTGAVVSHSRTKNGFTHSAMPGSASISSKISRLASSGKHSSADRKRSFRMAAALASETFAMSRTSAKCGSPSCSN